MPLLLENQKLEKITWNERKNTIFHAKYHDIRSIVCLLPEELLTFCFNLNKNMSSHFTRRIQDNIKEDGIAIKGAQSKVKWPLRSLIVTPLRAPPPPPPHPAFYTTYVCHCVQSDTDSYNKPFIHFHKTYISDVYITMAKCVECIINDVISNLSGILMNHDQKGW